MAIPTQFQDINGNEKRGILKHLQSLGHNYAWVDGQLNANGNEAQVLIDADAYQPLGHVKAEKIEALKQEARVRANALYPFIDVDKGEAEAFYQFASDLYLSIAPAARQPLSGSLLAFKNIKDAVTASVATINGYTTEAEVDAFDVVNTPAWGG